MTQASDTGLTVTLPDDRSIQMTRTFRAPARLVFEAHVQPEHVRRWWGMRGSELPTCEIDLRVGGTWRFVTREPDGNEFAFHGEYREIAPHTRLVYTEVLEPYPDESAGVNTLTLEERDGVTHLTVVSEYVSQEVRDMVIESGMEYGAAESYDRMEELLATLQ